MTSVVNPNVFGHYAVNVADTAHADGEADALYCPEAGIVQLIRPDGSIVCEWSYAQGFSWHYAEMLPNGNLVAIAKDKMILEINPVGELVQ